MIDTKERMFFEAGSKYKSGRIIVRPKNVLKNEYGQVVKQDRGLTVHIRNHNIDLDAQKDEKGWTDDEFDECVEHLLRVERSGVGRADGCGIYRVVHGKKGLSDVQKIKQSEEFKATACTSFEIDGDSTNFCGKSVIPGTLYCEDHTDATEEVGA